MPIYLFYLLCELIQKSYVSAINSPTESIYSFEMTDGENNVTIDLCTRFSHTGPQNCYIEYEMFSDNEQFARAIKPVFNTPSIPKDPTKIKNLADQLELLAYLCSVQVIRQELQSHKHHMLKSFINKYNQRMQ